MSEIRESIEMTRQIYQHGMQGLGVNEECLTDVIKCQASSDTTEMNIQST